MGKPVDDDIERPVDVEVIAGDVRISFLVGRSVVRNVDRVVAGVDGVVVGAIVDVDVLAAVVVVVVVEDDGQAVDEVMAHWVVLGVLVDVVVVPRVTARATGRTVVRTMRPNAAAVVETVRANLL